MQADISDPVQADISATRQSSELGVCQGEAGSAGLWRVWKAQGCARRDAKEDVPYHDREYDGSHGRFEDPEEGQAHHLQEGEEVDPAQRDVAQVDEVWLVF